MAKKPNVIPSKETKPEIPNSSDYEKEKLIVANEIYKESFKADDVPIGQLNAIEQMMARTAKQLEMNNQSGIVREVEYAETPKNNYLNTGNQDLIKKRDEQLKNNLSQIDEFQKLTKEASNRPINNQNKIMSETKNINNFNEPPINTNNNNIWDGYHEYNKNEHIQQISQPDYNTPFDIIPLPSKGKLYKGKRENIKISYMTTADENILSSPNLLQSGEFLEVLMNRKILDSIRYKDLLPGDRNAIMIWLRATSYGEIYPIIVDDEDGLPFETNVDLNELKTIDLTVEPDEDGLFTFVLPISKKVIRFKLLTCGEIDYLEKVIEKEKENNSLINNYGTYRLERMIVEIDGSRDRNYIKEVANNMRIPDAKKLTEFINTIDCGIDLNIEIETPGGGSLTTFLPLNLNFFWPNI